VYAPSGQAPPSTDDRHHAREQSAVSAKKSPNGQRPLGQAGCFGFLDRASRTNRSTCYGTSLIHLGLQVTSVPVVVHVRDVVKAWRWQISILNEELVL